MGADARATIVELIMTAQAAIPSRLKPDLPPGKFTGDAPGWYDFEHRIWETGENIRQLLLKKKRLRNDDELQAAFLSISTNRKAKRGRQSFVMLLGYKCCQEHASAIASQLDDSCVTGHVIGTLLKMHAGGFVDQIRPFTKHEIAWIRNKARAYCGRFAAAT